MFGFGPMSDWYDEDLENDFDPTEPFSQDEFVTHNKRELRNIDAGRNSDDDYERVQCPYCGHIVRFREDDADDGYADCPKCDRGFRVN